MKKELFYKCIFFLWFFLSSVMGEQRIHKFSPKETQKLNLEQWKALASDIIDHNLYSDNEIVEIIKEGIENKNPIIQKIALSVIFWTTGAKASDANEGVAPDFALIPNLKETLMGNYESNDLEVKGMSMSALAFIYSKDIQAQNFLFQKYDKAQSPKVKDALLEIFERSKLSFKRPKHLNGRRHEIEKLENLNDSKTKQEKSEPIPPPSKEDAVTSTLPITIQPPEKQPVCNEYRKRQVTLFVTLFFMFATGIGFYLWKKK